MTETAARIRWEDKTPGNGDVYLIASIGYIGTIEEPAFRIYTPDGIHARWLLSIRLTAGSQFRYADGPDELKRAAEDWLAGFVSSLGAVFPEPGRVAVNEAALETFIHEARSTLDSLSQETLLAAVEAALEQADDLMRKSEALDAEAEYIAGEHPEAAAVAVLKRERSIAYDECARWFRAAITAALAGKESGDDGPT